MSAVTFDTLKFTKTLEKAGLPAIQAEAISEAFKEASGETSKGVWRGRLEKLFEQGHQLKHSNKTKTPKQPSTVTTHDDSKRLQCNDNDAYGRSHSTM